MKNLIIYITSIHLLFSLSVFSQNGIIKGNALNAKNNEPLPFVSIAVQGTTIATTTDISGKFELKGLVPGSYNLSASYIGFEAVTIYEIAVTNSKPAEIDFLMVEKVKKLNEIEIKAEVFDRKEESPISLRTIGVSEISRNPGGNRDISKVLQSLPGVAPTVSYRNDIIIRGGAPNENRFYLDGIEVPNINHFATQGSSGGPVGMINVDFIREVDFYSSAFPASKNNSLSSIMEFKLSDGRSDKIGGKFTIGASDIGLSMEGPLNKNATFLASARRSYLQFLFKAIGLPFLPVYNDFQIKYKWKINLKNELTFIGLGAIDDFSLNTSLQENGTQQQKYILGYLPVNTQWNYVNGVKYIHYEKNGFITAVLSRNMLNNESYKYLKNIEEPQNKILDYQSQEIENKFRIERTVRKEDIKLTYGTNYEAAKYLNSTISRITTPNGIDTIDFNSKLNVLKWGIFGQISKSFFNSRLGASFGIRSDGNNYAKSMINSARQLSPRISVTYSITPELSINANTGLFYQLPPYTILGYRNSAGELVNKTNNITYIRAKHFVAGFEYQTPKNLKMNIEGFLKHFDQYPFVIKDSISLANLGSNFGVIGNEEVTSTSKGRSYGIEFLLQQKLFKGYYGLLTYTYVRSEFIDKNDQWVPSAWDNKHIVNITFGKSFKKNWELGAKWRYAMGSPYTPYNFDLSRTISVWNINQQGVPDYSLLNTQRLKAFHQLDLRVDKKYYYKKLSLNFYIDIQNVYNFKTDAPPILDVVRDANDNAVIDATDPTKYKAILLNDNTGTILPTIGVVIEF